MFTFTTSFVYTNLTTKAVEYKYTCMSLIIANCTEYFWYIKFIKKKLLYMYVCTYDHDSIAWVVWLLMTLYSSTKIAWQNYYTL